MNKIHANENKGFSLVELIVVIAIMAVMTAVLAPSLLQYVERSRAQKDDSAMGEVVNVIKLAMADQDVFDEVLTYTVKGNVNHYEAKADETAGTLKKLDADRTTENETGMRGVTITFHTTNGKKNAKYTLADGKVNESATGAAIDYFNGIKPKATDLSDMNAADDGTTAIADKSELYKRVLAGIGAEVKLSSQTYRNSDFTVFIDMGSAAGAAVNVYGEWEGRNLKA